ncbi:MAG TPA: GntG family PLP-dependent aldolase [Pseudolabrys sp.]|nr:GntG family PLP-dependent aldolase [Pseudolabrys sp.]
MTPIDLRSDTITKPTPSMMEHLVRAELGDDGRGDDPTVKRLEEMAAERMGKAAGLFVPSGTMGNLVSVLAHTGRSGEVLAEGSSHVFRTELGGVAMVAGLLPRSVPGQRGAMDLPTLKQWIRPPALKPTALGTALVSMETTHNAAGGAVLPLRHMAEVYRIARDCGVPVHLDGARIFNAAVALGVDAREIAAHADSVTFCISKGLSAPVGSLITGPADFIERARGFRRICGGNMRQSGLLAACGIVALEEMVARLKDDHAHARALADGLHRIDPSFVDPAAVETNIIMVSLPAGDGANEHWIKALNSRGVLASGARPGVLRLVTHRHIGADDVKAAVAAFAAIYDEQRGRVNAA